MSILIGLLLILAVAVFLIQTAFRIGFVRPLTVHDHEMGILFRDGRYIRPVRPGLYWLWGWSSEISTLDLRPTLLSGGLQQLLAADPVGVQLSLIINCNIEDPVKTIQESSDAQAELMVAAQAALREIAAVTKARDLVADPDALGSRIHKRIHPDVQRLGMKVNSIELRDVAVIGDVASLPAPSRKKTSTGGGQKKSSTSRKRSTTPAKKSASGSSSSPSPDSGGSGG